MSDILPPLKVGVSLPAIPARLGSFLGVANSGRTVDGRPAGSGLTQGSRVHGTYDNPCCNLGALAPS